MYSRAEFANYIDTDICAVDELLVRYGIPTVDALRAAKPKIMDYIPGTMRLGDISFKLIHLVLELFGTFPAFQRNRTNVYQIEEIVTPSRLAKYPIDMSALGGWPRPDKNMDSRLIMRFSEPNATYPPYVPYIVPNLATESWRPDNLEYRPLASGWNAEMKETHFSQPMPIRAPILTRLGFIPTADFCQASQHFGGEIAQFNALSHFPHLSTTEGRMVDIAYYTILRPRLEQFVRYRATNID